MSFTARLAADVASNDPAGAGVIDSGRKQVRS